MQHDRSVPQPKPELGLGFKEFVAMVASLMAINALSIDPMLPALPAIGKSLHIVHENDRQWIIVAYFMGLGVGSLLYGPLSDRYGRRPILLTCLGLFLVTTIFCAMAQSFAVMLAGRAMAGFFAAACRVISVSIVRDRFYGDRMARIMSLIFLVFMTVPILAPSFGQAVLLFARWRWIFWILAILLLFQFIWLWIRLPETLTRENRVAIRAADIFATLRFIVTHRSAIGYMTASGVVMGGLVGFITSVQQIFFDIFDRADIFPFAFAAIASFMCVGSFGNSRLVERIGARRLSQGALMAMILLSALHSLVAWAEMESVWSFIAFQALTMLAFAFTGSNFGAISMEPFSRGAGMASSFQAFLTTIVSALLGAFVGSQFNGTTLPLALGFMTYGAVAMLLVIWAEKGKLFTRPNRGGLRSSNVIQ